MPLLLTWPIFRPSVLRVSVLFYDVHPYEVPVIIRHCPTIVDGLGKKPVARLSSQTVQTNQGTLIYPHLRQLQSTVEFLLQATEPCQTSLECDSSAALPLLSRVGAGASRLFAYANSLVLRYTWVIRLSLSHRDRLYSSLDQPTSGWGRFTEFAQCCKVLLDEGSSDLSQKLYRAMSNVRCRILFWGARVYWNCKGLHAEDWEGFSAIAEQGSN